MEACNFNSNECFKKICFRIRWFMVHWYIAGSLWQCLQSIALLISAKTDYLKAYYQTFDKLMISFVTIELWKPFAPTLYEGDDCFYTIRTDGRGGGAYVIHHQHCWQCFEGFIQVVYSVAYNSPLNLGTLQKKKPTWLEFNTFGFFQDNISLNCLKKDLSSVVQNNGLYYDISLGLYTT